MANHKSAIKRHKQSLKRNERNKHFKSSLATQMKKAKAKVLEKSARATEGEVKNAVSLLAKLAGKGIVKKKTASRRTSRLMKAANACQG